MRVFEENFVHFGEPLGKIGKEFGGDFPFIASCANNAGHQDPSWRVWVQRNFGRDRPAPEAAENPQSSRISSVKRFFNFIPAAPKSVRTALAVRPWRPITFPKSSGCTRNSNTVTCDPSTDFTSTSSGWSTRALAIASTSSFIWATPLAVISSGNLPRPPETVHASTCTTGKSNHDRRGAPSRSHRHEQFSGSWDVAFTRFSADVENCVLYRWAGRPGQSNACCG